eukprot:Nk52_evm94s217 gene=Nk52_evmTU94s217
MTRVEDFSLCKPETKLNLGTLVDSFRTLYEHCNTNPKLSRDASSKDFVERYKESVSQLSSKGALSSRKDFDVVQVIGRGAFGEVAIARWKKADNGIYALKILKKAEMIKRSDTALFWAERDLLVQTAAMSGDSKFKDWIVSLHCSFQDPNFLYFVMDYCPGGDFLSLLSKFEFTEEWARFYSAEIIVCVQTVHDLGFIHRDVKPDNFLIDFSGHLKITDFGSCAKVDESGVVQGNVAVGTPDYISPEVLEAQGGHKTYGFECDWWSVGIVIYEMLIGETPFESDSLLDIYSKILNFKEKVDLPEDAPVLSEEIVSLIHCFLTRKNRLGCGKGGISEIKAHPFYTGLTWESLREMSPPWSPNIASESDTSNFNDFIEEDEPSLRFLTSASTSTVSSASSAESFCHASSVCTSNSGCPEIKESLPFVGFSFDPNVFSLVNSQNENTSSAYEAKVSGLEARNDNLVQENASLSSKLCERECVLSETKENLRVSEKQKSWIEIQKNDIQEKLDGLTLNSKIELEKKDAELEACRGALKLKVESLKALEKKLQSATEEKSSQINSLSDKLNKIKAKLSSQESNAEDNVKALEEKDTLIESLRASVRALEKKLENRDAEYVRKDTACETSQKRKISPKRVCMEQASREMLEIEASKKAAVEVERLQRENEELQSKIKTLSCQLTESQNTAIELQSMFETEEDCRIECEDNFNDLKAMFDLKAGFCKSLEDDISILEDEKDRLKISCRTLSALNEEIHSKLNNCQLSLKKSQQEMIELKNEKAEMIADLKAQLSTKGGEIEALKNDCKLKSSLSDEASVKLKRKEEECSKQSLYIQRLEEQLQSLNKMNSMNKLKLVETVRKLDEFLKSGKDTNTRIFKVRKDDKKKLNEVRNLQRKIQDESRENQKHLKTINSLERERDALECSVKKLEAKVKTLSRGGENKENIPTKSQTRQISIRPVGPNCSSDDYLIEGWLKTPKGKSVKQGWKKVYGLVDSQRILCIYHTGNNGSFSKADAAPIAVIDLNELFHVRAVKDSDVIHCRKNDIKLIFQILYSKSRSLSKSTSSGICHNKTANLGEGGPAPAAAEDNCQVVRGHEFTPHYFNVPKNCSFCAKLIYGFVKHGFLCKQCGYSAHKKCFSQSPPCMAELEATSILLMAPSEAEKDLWIDNLSSISKKFDPSKRHTSSSSSPSAPTSTTDRTQQKLQEI